MRSTLDPSAASLVSVEIAVNTPVLKRSKGAEDKFRPGMMTGKNLNLDSLFFPFADLKNA